MGGLSEQIQVSIFRHTKLTKGGGQQLQPTFHPGSAGQSGDLARAAEGSYRHMRHIPRPEY